MNELGVAGWLFHRSILNEKTLTLLELPAAVKALGVGTVELVSTFFESQNARYLNELRAAIAENGLTVRSIAVDMGNIANADAMARRTDLEALKQWFYTARAIGCAAIRVNSGAASPDDQEAIARITEGYRELAAEAAHSGVTLMIENHGGASADPKNIKAFLEGVNSPSFRSCPDTGNFPGNTWREGMQVMAPHAFSCHVKVFSYSPDGVQTWTGRDGQPRTYDLKESLRILQAAGYTGPLCVEAGASATEMDSGRDAIKYLRELVATM